MEERQVGNLNLRVTCRYVRKGKTILRVDTQLFCAPHFSVQSEQSSPREDTEESASSEQDGTGLYEKDLIRLLSDVHFVNGEVRNVFCCFLS